VVKVFRQLENDPRYRIRWPKRGTVGVVEVVAAAATAQPGTSPSAE
jgi:hypothetical protein